MEQLMMLGKISLPLKKITIPKKNIYYVTFQKSALCRRNDGGTRICHRTRELCCCEG
jgi:hypothetical protein